MPELTQEERSTLIAQAKKLHAKQKDADAVSWLDEKQFQQLKRLQDEGYKAYLVSIELDYVVVAKDEREAQDLGEQALRDDSPSSYDFDASPLNHLPADWDHDSLAWHDSGQGDIEVITATHLPGGYRYKDSDAPDPNQQDLFPRKNKDNPQTRR